MGNYLFEVNLGSGLSAQSLHIGNVHSCVVLNDNSLKCFGDNPNGQLGIGNTFDQGDQSNEMGDYLGLINLGTGVEVQECFDYSPTSSPSFGPTPIPPLLTDCSSSFALGSTVCMLTSISQQVKCWGKGNNGQLGNQAANNVGVNPMEMGDYMVFNNLAAGVISVHAGADHFCTRLTSLNIKCWGVGDHGELGYGDTLQRGDSIGEMGVYLPLVNLGPSIIIARMACGTETNLAITNSGLLKSWGRGLDGSLGYGNSADIGDNPGEMGSYRPYVNLGSGQIVHSVKAGQFASCALLISRNMKCFGSNLYGQLGYGDTTNRGDGSNEMGIYLDLVNFPSGMDVEFLSGGWHHFGILATTNNIYLWGRNDGGQLGLGHATQIGGGTNHMGDYLQSANLGSGRTVFTFTAGAQHSCVILDNFNAKCFGNGGDGQLGYGDTSKRGNLANQMGDYLLK